MNLEKLIKERLERLESVPEGVQSVIVKQETLLFKQVLKDIGTLETKDGKIVASKDNLAKINGILENLKKVLFSSDYLEAVKSFATEISTQAKINNDILRLTIGSFKDDELYNATVKAAQRNALLLLDENAVVNELLQPLSEILTTATTQEMSFSDAAEILRGKMTGEQALYTKYAGTYVKDVFSISDAQYSDLISRKHGIEFYRYSGVKVESSRLFCVERMNKVFHRKEIEQWGRGVNTEKGKFERPKYLHTNKRGDKIYWEGMNYDTNGTNIFSYRGGYTCNHALVPITTDRVPKEDLERAKRLGFYQ